MRIPILLHCKFSESCLLRLCKKKFGFDGYSKWGIFGIVVTWHFLAFIQNTFLKCPCRNTCKTTCTPTCNSILWKVIVSKTFPIVCVKKDSFRSYKILKQTQAVSPAPAPNSKGARSGTILMCHNQTAIYKFFARNSHETQHCYTLEGTCSGTHPAKLRTMGHYYQP